MEAAAAQIVRMFSPEITEYIGHKLCIVSLTWIISETELEQNRQFFDVRLALSIILKHKKGIIKHMKHWWIAGKHDCRSITTWFDGINDGCESPARNAIMGFCAPLLFFSMFSHLFCCLQRRPSNDFVSSKCVATRAKLNSLIVRTRKLSMNIPTSFLPQQSRPRKYFYLIYKVYHISFCCMLVCLCQRNL